MCTFSCICPLCSELLWLGTGFEFSLMPCPTAWGSFLLYLFNRSTCLFRQHWSPPLFPKTKYLSCYPEKNGKPPRVPPRCPSFCWGGPLRPSLPRMTTELRLPSCIPIDDIKWWPPLRACPVIGFWLPVRQATHFLFIIISENLNYLVLLAWISDRTPVMALVAVVSSVLEP